MPKDKTCCLCGLPYERIGNNPQPLAGKGRCCDACNEVVTEARISPAQMSLEIMCVAQTIQRKLAAPLGEVALAAICAARGPGLLAQRQRELALLREKLFSAYPASLDEDPPKPN